MCVSSAYTGRLDMPTKNSYVVNAGRDCGERYVSKMEIRVLHNSRTTLFTFFFLFSQVIIL